MEFDLAGHRESQPQIKLDGVRIFGADMEPGHLAFTAMISREMPDETRSVTFAAMCGMGADAADLGVVVERYTFSTHRDQFPVGSHTIVGTHFACSAAEEPGEREVSEGNHLGCVCAGEWDDPGRRSDMRFLG